MLKTPVAFIIFNRPELTQAVFNQIKRAQPRQLFVIADGARFVEEEERCQRTRNIINQVDWDCEVFRDFSDKNLGGPYRCSSGLDWVFSKVEEAIILEDDCLPEDSFFHFCDQLLAYYKNNYNIMHITGNNFQRGQSRTQYSYYFSRYASCWGWATWRRAWEKFDIDLTTWPQSKTNCLLDDLFTSVPEVQFWTYIFDRVFTKEAVHWDYAWKYACFKEKGLVIVPDVNLVSNIGFNLDATHTTNPHAQVANLPTIEMLDIQHPEDVQVDYDADAFAFNFRFKHKIPKSNPSIMDNMKLTLKRVIKKLLKLIFKRVKKKYSKQYHVYSQLIAILYGKAIRQIKRPSFPEHEKGQRYLHLGCGPVNHPIFINVDGLPYRHVHYVRSIDDLKPFANESVDLVYASHCMEHFSFEQIPSVLSEWHRVLRQEGILRLSVPDFDLLLKIYMENGRDLTTIMKPLMGGQDYKFNFHYSVFNDAYLKHILIGAGFASVRKWIPGSSYTTTFNDWSCRSIIINGKAYPVSLNLEAVK